MIFCMLTTCAVGTVTIIVTYSEKRDLTEIFMNTEILAWIDACSSVYSGYNGVNFKEKH